jgi:hypothetical protein
MAFKSLDSLLDGFEYVSQYKYRWALHYD